MKLTLKKRKAHSRAKESAEKIVSSVVENLDDEIIKSGDATAIAEEAYNQAQEFVAQNSEIDTSKIDTTAELPENEREATIELFQHIARTLIREENIPDDAAEEFILNLIRNDSPKIGVEVAKGTPSLPDESISNIISRPEVTIKDSEALLKGIDDDEKRNKIQEDLCIEKLTNLYQNCSQMRDGDVVSEITDALRKIDVKSGKINEYIDKIIAKKMATNVRQFGSSMTRRFYGLKTPLEMLESKLPELVGSEYSKSASNFVHSQTYPYNTQDFKDNLIEELGREIGNKFQDLPESKRTIMIPSSDVVRNFNEHEEELFINAIRINAGKNPPKEHEIQHARNQIHGLYDTDEVLNLKNNLNSIVDIEERDYIAKSFNDILSNLTELDSEQQKKALDTLVEVTGNAVNKSAKENSSDAPTNAQNNTDSKIPEI